MSNRIDLQPQYGKWTLVGEVDPRPNGNGDMVRHVHVRCACGLERVVKLGALTRGTSKGCRRCASHDTHPHLIGTTSGDWTILEVDIRVSEKDAYRFKVQCKCGTERLVRASHILSGKSKSCGCAKYLCGPSSRHFKGCEEVTGSFMHLLKESAKTRGIPVTITAEYLWGLFLQQDRKCALSGIPLHIRPNRGRGTASVDRINSDKGYVEGNVQWVLKDINLMKRDFSQAVFIALCSAVHDYRKDEWLSPVLLKFLEQA